MIHDPLHSVSVLGVRVDDVTLAEAIDRIEDLVGDGRATRSCHQIATVNVDFVVNALGDEHLRAILESTSLSIPDGMPIVWGARWCGTPLRERVSGADLVQALAPRAAASGLRLYLFGSAPGVAERAAAELIRRAPDLEAQADSGGRFADVLDTPAEALERIRTAAPDILLVALGNPKQERWIAEHGQRLGVPVAIGVGGSFDLLIGDKRRAPGWMQRAGLEWCYRAVQEPGRLVRRYARDAFVFGPRLLRQIVRTRWVAARGRSPS